MLIVVTKEGEKESDLAVSREEEMGRLSPLRASERNKRIAELVLPDRPGELIFRSGGQQMVDRAKDFRDRLASLARSEG